MYELMFMCAGSALTVIAAYLSTIGKDKPKISNRKTVAIVDNGGNYVIIADKTTGEILQEYKYSNRTEWGEFQYNEKRIQK